MRRAPHDRQEPRRLQLKATRLSWPQSPQSPQRRRKMPWARMPVALVVDRGAIGRPLGLPADGLHARLPYW